MDAAIISHLSTLVDLVDICDIHDLQLLIYKLRRRYSDAHEFNDPNPYDPLLTKAIRRLANNK